MKTTIIFLYILLGLVACLPQVPKYPFQNPESLNQDAQKLSDDLEAYIKLWHQGKASEVIPQNLLPKGHDPDRFKNALGALRSDRPSKTMDYKTCPRDRPL